MIDYKKALEESLKIIGRKRYNKTLDAAYRIIDRKYSELDYIRRGLADLKNRRYWKDIKEVDEFIDKLINYRE